MTSETELDRLAEVVRKIVAARAPRGSLDYGYEDGEIE